MTDEVKDIDIGSLKLAAGKREFVKWVNGERLTFKQKILAHCYDCMNYYVDGRVDCKNSRCVLYSNMPYRDIVLKKTYKHQNAYKERKSNETQ